MPISPLNNIPKADPRPARFHPHDPAAVPKIVSALISSTPETVSPCEGRIVICIGSDRSTGDSLGPLVGTSLALLDLPRVTVAGTLAEPVHALNLESTIKKIIPPGETHPLTIAIDASLGKPNNIGTIEVGSGPLYPGRGVYKKLPPVGHLYLSGVVNIGGFMEQMVLQSTRLFEVMKLAATISAALQQFLSSGRQYKFEPPPLPLRHLERFLRGVLTSINS